MQFEDACFTKPRNRGVFMSINEGELDTSRVRPAKLHSRIHALGMDCMPRMQGRMERRMPMIVPLE